VARRLLSLADENQPGYRAQWAELFGSVAATSVFEADVELLRAHVHPDALLQTVVTPWDYGGPLEKAPSLGPFKLAARDDDATHYVANDRYFAEVPGQPRELFERVFADERKALTALKTGEIAVLDRVPPWEAEALRQSKQLTVDQYAAPTVHCLIPNLKKPLLARRSFRRALLYGLNREDILNNQLLLNSSPQAGQVVSGPFPRGAGVDDPLGYAYNESVQPFPYEPLQTLTFVDVARMELAAAAREAAAPQPAPGAPPAKTPPAAPPLKREDLPEIPPLVLVHPPHAIARVACRSIQRQLKMVKVQVTLRELPPGQALPEGDFDLLYAELAMWEPVVDARRLLGPDGPSGGCSAHLDLALRQLAMCDNWKQARDKLLQIHEQAAADVAVLPLWQLTDYFAYQRGLEGIGKQPVSLYQNIESWRSPPWFMAEAL
jgi:ABC-type transport system substrate-binding protein